MRRTILILTLLTAALWSVPSLAQQRNQFDGALADINEAIRLDPALPQP
jgi:hypothetical protein